MPRQGLNKEIILKEAINIINRHGYNKVSFTVMASIFNVKPPAMFKHYKNLAALKEALALYGIKLLKQYLQDAVTGKSGEEALNALCHAYRQFAKSNHGLYQAIQPAFFGKNKEIEQSAMQLMNIMVIVLKGFNIPEEHFIHFLRVIRSSLHGFIVMEIEFGFGMQANIDTSFEHQIKAIQSMIKSIN